MQAAESPHSDALASVPEEEYWLAPDRMLEVRVARLGTMEITGQFLDYMPAAANPDELFEPAQDEFRLWDPVLICESRVVVNVPKSSATDTGKCGYHAVGTGIGTIHFLRGLI